MSKNLNGEGMVKARNISTMRGCKEKVEFYAADKKIASYPKINKNDYSRQNRSGSYFNLSYWI